MSLLKMLFGSFPSSDHMTGYSDHKGKKQKSLGESIVGSVMGDIRKAASDIDKQVNKRK
jgi:hypothetical protein